MRYNGDMPYKGDIPYKGDMPQPLVIYSYKLTVTSSLETMINKEAENCNGNIKTMKHHKKYNITKQKEAKR
jgi:hypothetical protein